VRTPIICSLFRKEKEFSAHSRFVSSSFFDRRAKEEIAQISKEKKKQKETDFGKLFFNFHRGESREFTDLEYVITFATRRTSETLIPNINQKIFYFDVSFCAQLKEKHT